MRTEQIKISFFFLANIIGLSFVTHAQKGTTVETKYLRPSVTYLYVNSNDNKIQKLVSSLKRLPVEDQFNDNNINYDDLQSPVNDSKIRDYVIGATNPIMKKWWQIDEKGNFHTNLIKERGMYTASDADVLADKAAQASRLEMLGGQLIDKSYIAVIDITSVKSMEVIYDEQDEAGRNVKGYTPVKRTEEGYEVKYTTYLYKMNYTDSCRASFYEKYYTDAEDHDDKKVIAWKNARFPVKLVSTTSKTVTSKQPKDPNDVRYKLFRKKSMDELLEDVPAKIQAGITTQFSKNVGDFQSKASVFSEKPLSAKIGKKEGVKPSQRFLIYEIQVNPKTNNQFKKRKGVARATTKISNNKSISSGDTKPTIFQQQGGKKVYTGMLLELHDDLGINIGLGYRSNSGDLSQNGINGCVEVNASKWLGKIIPTTPLGFYFGFSYTYNGFSNVNSGNVLTDNMVLYSSSIAGYAEAMEVTLHKEWYFTRKGNIYLIPTFSYGVSHIEVTKVDGSKVDSASAKYYKWSAPVYNLGLGLGLNITPRFTLTIKPSFVMKEAYKDGTNSALKVDPSNNPDPKWGPVFNNLAGSLTSIQFLINLKYRL